MKYGDYTGGQVEAVINRMGGFANWVRFAGGQGKIVFDSILVFVRTIRISAQPAVTTSEKYFEGAGVRWTNDFFKSEFHGLNVEKSTETELRVSKLEQNSPDAPILTELGDKTEISVGQFHTFLSENRESSEWFILYLRGKSGLLCAVRAHWYHWYHWYVRDDGWRVDADSVAYSHRWSTGFKVVSRN